MNYIKKRINYFIVLKVIIIERIMIGFIIRNVNRNEIIHW